MKNYCELTPEQQEKCVEHHKTETGRTTRMKYTPEPWKITDLRDNRVYSERTGAHYAIDGGEGLQPRGSGFRPALILGDGTENRGLALANARLIAAAPEMLAALKFLQPLAIRHAPLGIDEEYWNTAFENLEAAITKIEHNQR